MSDQALRIYAHGGRRPLRGPSRPASTPLATVHARHAPVLVPTPVPDDPTPTAPPVAAPIAAAPGEHDEPAPPPPRPEDEPTTAPDDPRILEILIAPPQFGETVEAAYRRKEVALRELFGALPLVEATVLHRRLVDPRPGDPVAARFTRLVIDRRTRLLAFLADAPRRDAIAGARRP